MRARKRIVKNGVISILQTNNRRKPNGNVNRSPRAVGIDLRDRLIKSTMSDARQVLDRKQRTGVKPRTNLTRTSNNNSRINPGLNKRRSLNRPLKDARSLLTTRIDPNKIPLPQITIRNDYFDKSPTKKKQNMALTTRFQRTFETNSRSEEFPSTSSRRRLSDIQGYRVEVTGLLPSIVLDDIYELFCSIGKLKSCQMMKIGSAHVVFENLQHAIESVKNYHSRELDGKPMSVKLITPVSQDDLLAAKRSAPVYNDSSQVIDDSVVHRALFNTQKGSNQFSTPVEFQVEI